MTLTRYLYCKAKTCHLCIRLIGPLAVLASEASCLLQAYLPAALGSACSILGIYNLLINCFFNTGIYCSYKKVVGVNFFSL